MRWRAVVLAAALTALPPAATNGQEPPSLDRAEELTRLGRAEEARGVLARWWAEAALSASRRDTQRALWLRGRLTVDPAQAELDFGRLVIEYPGGPWSDQALLRLAQSAFAAGDSARAAEHVERLAREYPASPARREAVAWLAVAGSPPAGAPGGEAGVAREVAGEVARPAEAADTAARADTVVAAATVPAADSAAREARGAPPRYAVQLGAFRSEERARALVRGARDAGFEARLVRVPGSALIRVRVGSFDAPEGADAILVRLRRLGFTAALARDAHLEERVGR